MIEKFTMQYPVDGTCFKLNEIIYSYSDSEDPDEMPYKEALHLGMHCFLIQNRSSDKEKQYILEILTCDPSIYTMDHPDFIVCSFIEYSICLKSVLIMCMFRTLVMSVYRKTNFLIS